MDELMETDGWLECDETCLWCGELSDTDICGTCQERYEMAQAGTK